jgi:hypothetical protein
MKGMMSPSTKDRQLYCDWETEQLKNEIYLENIII